MDIKTKIRQDISILSLIGELDAGNAVQVDSILIFIIKKEPKQIWVDGSNLEYISSAGLGVFLSHLPAIKKNNIKLVFFGLSDKIRNVFTILGLEELLNIVPDEETALQYFG